MNASQSHSGDRADDVDTVDGASDVATDDRLRIALRRTLWVIVAAVVGYAVFALVADLRALGAHLADVAVLPLIAAFGLSLVNYVLRGVRWEYYLRLLDLDVPRRASLLLFVSGFGFSVTPGKIGEVLKSLLMKRDFGVPVARSLPVVVGERLTDFVALAALMLVGVATYQFHSTALIAVVLCVVGGILVLATSSLWRPIFRGLRRWERLAGVIERLEAMAETLAELLRPRPLIVALLLSAVAWGAECVGLWAVAHAFGLDVSLQLATFVYAATTLLGALAMMPAGLGVTDASMATALVLLAGVDRTAAVGTTLLTRIATLWFAVILGFVALGWYRRVVASSGRQAREPNP